MKGKNGARPHYPHRTPISLKWGLAPFPAPIFMGGHSLKKQKARPDPKRNLQWKERLDKIIVILTKIFRS